MSVTLTPSQALLVWCLVAKQGAAWQAEIKPKVDAKDRQALQTAKMLSAKKIKGYGNALWLELDPDHGWGWAAANLDAELPPNYRALSDLLIRLRDHIKTAEESLADVIGAGLGAPPEKSAAKAAKPKATAKPKTTSKPKTTPKPKAGFKPKAGSKPEATSKPEQPVDVRAAIETAYLAVTGQRKGVEARLSDVRAKLALPTATVDAALEAIQLGDPKARLMRIDDQRSITTADREAAFVFAGERFHILWIMP